MITENPLTKMCISKLYNVKIRNFDVKLDFPRRWMKNMGVNFIVSHRCSVVHAEQVPDCKLSRRTMKNVDLRGAT